MAGEAAIAFASLHDLSDDKDDSSLPVGKSGFAAIFILFRFDSVSLYYKHV